MAFSIDTRTCVAWGFILLVLLEAVLTFILNDTLLENNRVDGVKIGGRRKKSKSTSSSETRGASEETEAESLDLSSEGSITTSDEKKHKKHKYKPVSSAERTGWRKWHRKCTPCPEDMVKKWRDPTINWICGAYQRARRSFKSACMMRYRNCQDGTMFTKIHDHRCENNTKAHGDHFFYEYKVVVSDIDLSSTSDVSSSSELSSSGGIY